MHLFLLIELLGRSYISSWGILGEGGGGVCLQTIVGILGLAVVVWNIVSSIRAMLW